jgi:hypothetical protein
MTTKEEGRKGGREEGRNGKLNKMKMKRNWGTKQSEKES